MALALIHPRATPESDQLESVVARLCEAYPDLDETDVRDAVACAHRRLDGARLRQFVPLLVEREARADCRTWRAAKQSHTGQQQTQRSGPADSEGAERRAGAT